MLLSEQTFTFHMPQRSSNQEEERHVYDKLLLDTEADLKRSSYHVTSMMEDSCDLRTPAPATAGHRGQQG